MTVGERLREAREAQEMTIGDVSRRTFIQPKFLQAIEENSFGSIPIPQRRFFVRDYARVVGLDPESLLAELPDTPPPPSTTADSITAPILRSIDSLPDTDRRRRDRFKPMTFGDVRRRNANIANWIIAAALLLLLVAGGYLFFKDRFGEGSQTSRAVLPSDSTVTPTEIVSAAEDTVTAAERPGDDSLTLVGTATAQVWFSVVMDGQRNDQGVLDSGATRTWRAMETFKVSLGNAGGLQLSLNDKLLGALGPKRTIVRNQIIDATGIKKKAPRPVTSGAQGGTSTPTQTQRGTTSTQPRATTTRPPVRPSPPKPSTQSGTQRRVNGNP